MKLRRLKLKRLKLRRLKLRILKLRRLKLRRLEKGDKIMNQRNYCKADSITLDGSINRYANFLEEVYCDVLKRLGDAPEDNIHVKHIRGSDRYFRYIPGTGDFQKYIPMREENEIAALAQKKYDEKLAAEIESELKMLRKAGKTEFSRSIERVYSDMNPALKSYVRPAVMPDEKFIEVWEAQEYPRKGFRADEGLFITKKGERVRSKTERFIADCLCDAGVPYRYEYPVKLGKIPVHPDFTVLNRRTRREYFWEHFGMLDVEEYRKGMLSKMNLYAEHGIISGVNLITTFEAAEFPVNSGMVKEIIKAYLK